MVFNKLIRSPEVGNSGKRGSRFRKVQYGELEKEGAALQKCFTFSPGESNDTKARVIEFSGYTPWAPQDFVKTGWTIERVGWKGDPPLSTQGWKPAIAPLTPLPWSILPVAKQLGISTEPIYKTVSLFKLVKENAESDYSDYIIQVGPGVIVSQLSSRFMGPHWSDVALAVYKQYETAPLKYVFRVDITNEIVERLISEEIYSVKTGLRWPDSVQREWQISTCEYKALLGTPLGRGVVALVLRGYDRGKKLISSISTFSDEQKVSMHMLFVISDQPR
ncbi:uncharacterized protein N7473_010774 [Penicillium subrubescens]|uniref:Uncharacterized protein n=1 Tax=Penicillium subrubescens TaxID=1316194 RepID=A0A1Q5T2N0_9EURO|nr:uncharacterized protein N7473_010774 [Penicillium subrubescens]KAJ5883888.1 hypothetical protein N7473_010774 [Penicillium subrubescens]OKO94500.1 hypothetical protein PENSUB_11767 [Penicillium subrubescens]